MQLDCSQSVNCICSRESMVHVVEVEAHSSSVSKKNTVLDLYNYVGTMLGYSCILDKHLVIHRICENREACEVQYM